VTTLDIERPELEVADENLGQVALPDPVSWAARAGAITLDVLPGAAVLATAGLAALAMPTYGPRWWTCVAVGSIAILWTGVNRTVLPAIWGYSLGRAMFDIRVTARDGGVVGPWWLLMRDVAHLLDTALLIGWLWPLWDARRGTFADMVSRTQARRRHAPDTDRPSPRLAAALMLAAASVCGALALLSYTAVGQHDTAVSQARNQVVANGPNMIEQLLSYRPDSIAADFDRARTLVSDGYRPQLAAQQQAIQKANPVRNKYWVVKSSVLDATPHAVSMLLFLEGERGNVPDLRYITASVRARFIDPGNSVWRVDSLDIVTAPQSSERKP